MPFAHPQNSWVHRWKPVFHRCVSVLSALLCFKSCPTVVQRTFLEVFSASCLWWQPGRPALSFPSAGGEKRWLSFNTHKITGRSGLLPVFPWQPSCSSEDLTRSSLLELKPVSRAGLQQVGIWGSVCILKNNPNKQHRLCLSPGVLFQMVHKFIWLDAQHGPPAMLIEQRNELEDC